MNRIAQFGIRAGRQSETIQASFEAEYAAAADRLLNDAGQEAFEAIKVVNQWAGHYDFNVLDHNLIVGRHPEVTNFVFANGAALVPTFGTAQDAEALAVLRELLPGRDVVGVPSGDLVLGLGALHCLSQQEPV